MVVKKCQKKVDMNNIKHLKNFLFKLFILLQWKLNFDKDLLYKCLKTPKLMKSEVI